MRYSGSYIIMEFMVRQNGVMFPELEQMTDTLERRGLITTREHEDLLQLGRKLLPKAPIPAPIPASQPRAPDQ